MPPDYRMSPGPSNSATLGFYAQAVENEQEEEDEESYSDIEMDDTKEILKWVLTKHYQEGCTENSYFFQEL